MSEQFYVYILTNTHHTVFYTGVTNNLMRRIYEHKNKLIKGFTSKYNADKLIYFETTDSVEAAIIHEKRVKRWARPIKCDAISRMNPDWKDLYFTLTHGDPGTSPG